MRERLAEFFERLAAKLHNACMDISRRLGKRDQDVLCLKCRGLVPKVEFAAHLKKWHGDAS